MSRAGDRGNWLKPVRRGRESARRSKFERHVRDEIMRLLHTTTLRLEYFHNGNRPNYAILSHTWYNEEVLFDDLQRRRFRTWRNKHGFSKLRGFCDKAKQSGYDYVWIDTCCIDKSSSAELSEAINSMFDWYNRAAVCYVYLEDVTADAPLDHCRWFTRGWTLQELIAPTNVKFFDKNWKFIGDRFSLASILQSITGIDETVLRHGHASYPEQWSDHKSSNDFVPFCLSCGCRWWVSIHHDGLSQFSIAQRMSWASTRQTTREEDIGYSLLGLFGVNMPLLYGEGRQAFVRLQEEIIKRNEDQSILAHTQVVRGDILATSPECFKFGKIYLKFGIFENVDLLSDRQNKIYLANGGVCASILICPLRNFRPLDSEAYFIGILDCAMGDDLLSRPAILLKPVSDSEGVFRRFLPGILCCVDSPGSGRLIVTAGGDQDLLDFDISQALSRRIIILPEYDLRQNPVFQGLPLRIKPLIEHDDTYKYTIEDSFPERTNEFMVGSNRHSPRGIIMFNKPWAPRFCVVWESGTSYPDDSADATPRLWIWCKIWQLQDLKRALISASEDATFAQEVMRGVRMRHRAFDWLYDIEPESQTRRDSLKLQDIEKPRLVTAEISSVEFLGRVILELEVQFGNVDVSRHIICSTEGS